MSLLDNILERLIQRTAEGRLVWRRPDQNNQFVISVDSITVSIRDLRGAMGYVSLGHRLEIMNEGGETVEVLDPTNHTTTVQEKQLERLFMLARRSALETQTTLKKLAKALTAE